MRANGLYDTAHTFAHASITRMQRGAHPAKIPEGNQSTPSFAPLPSGLPDRVLHAVRGEARLAEKFRVGQDGSQRMPQIMRDGTGHAPNGCQPLGFQQLLLGLHQGMAHAIEGAGQLADFIAGEGAELILEIAFFQGTYASSTSNAHEDE